MADLEEEQIDGLPDPASFTLIEYPAKDLLDNIFRHPDLYDTDRQRLRKYCSIAKQGNGNIKITYQKKGKFGRYYPVNGSILSSIYMWRDLRSSLFSDTEYDIDVKSCHFQLLINQVKHFVSLDNLQSLIHKRDEFFKLFYINQAAIDLYNQENKDNCVKKDIIKKLLTRILYGGLLSNWYKEFNFSQEDVIIPEWYNLVEIDIKQGISMLKKLEKCNENDIFEEIKAEILYDEHVKWDKEQENICLNDKRKSPKPFKPDNVKIPQPKILARYFQEKESNIIDNVREQIHNEFGIVPTAYCYDGLQFRKNDITDIDGFVNRINELNDVVFEIKQFDKKLKPIADFVNGAYFDYKEFLSIPSTEEKIIYFNQFYFKIHSLNSMCYIDDKGTLIKIKDDNSHFAKILPHWKWLQTHESLIEFFAYGIYPNQDLCPDKVYNIWKGFDVEKNNSCQDEDIDISTILYHFEVVANFDDKLYNYLLNYFAHLFQKPEIKTNVCLLIQGKQGTGKNTLVETLLKKLMGKRYVFDTADVEKVVGKFNSSIAGKLMIVLNEVSGRDTNTVVDKIKDIITRTDVSIEHKGCDSFEVVDYCNYTFTTNNLKPIPITSDDRRFQVIECSDKHKGDYVYFNKLYATINNDNVMYAFYKFLMKRDISKFNTETHRVITEAALDLHELNKDPVELFLDYLHTDEFDKYENKIKSRHVYELFKRYSDGIGYKNVCNFITFCKILKNYSSKYKYNIIQPKNVSTIVFNWEIECLVDD